MNIRAAIPGLGFSIAGSLIWAGCMALSAFAELILRKWGNDANLAVIVIIFAIGGMLAFVPALILARLLASGGQLSQRFAAAFVALTVATIGATSLVFYFQFRAYYAQWHDEMFSYHWLVQTLTTGAAAAYQFGVLGTRFFFPLGIILLFAMSFWLAKNKV